MHVTFQKIEIFAALFLLTGSPMAARASEPIIVEYGAGHRQLMNLTMEAQSQLKKGDLATARRSLDAIIKADPTLFPAYYIRAEVFLLQHKYREAVQIAMRHCGKILLLPRPPCFGPGQTITSAVMPRV